MTAHGFRFGLKKVVILTEEKTPTLCLMMTRDGHVPSIGARLRDE